MLLLNVGCGDTRLPEPWINMDDLHNHFPVGHPERKALVDRLNLEPNYKNVDLNGDWWEKHENFVDGVLISHVLEHFDMPGAVHCLREAYQCLKPGGVCRVSVPNGSYFREVYPRDRRENWSELFEDASDVSENETYFDVALFFHQHRQVYTEDALWCQMMRAGFRPPLSSGDVRRVGGGVSEFGLLGEMLAVMDNRRRFSLFMEVVK